MVREPGQSAHGGVRATPHASARVDVWIADARNLAGAPLPAEDREAARRLHRPADRRACLGRRALLRGVFALYLGVSPSEVTIERRCEHCGGNGHGRPRLHAGPVHASVSSCGDTVVAAAAARPVGVDVEARRTLPALAELAAAALTADEQRELTREPDPDAGFLVAWCAKEALLKAAGTGLAYEPNRVDGLAALRGKPWSREGTGYVAAPLPLGRDLIGAVALCGREAPTLDLQSPIVVKDPRDVPASPRLLALRS